MGHIFLHSFTDTIKVFPLIFIVYVIIEYLEHKSNEKSTLKRVLVGRFSPLFGAVFGIIPQCGFSVVATKFYQKGLIYLGTLLAVFIATSDEALPIMLSFALSGELDWSKFWLLILVKVAYAVIVGFVVNLFVAKKQGAKAEVEFDEEYNSRHDGCCGHEINGKKASVWQFLSHPFFHSLKIIAYIFVVNFLLGVVIELLVGEERLGAFLTNSMYVQPLICSAVGLVPNCAISVILTDLYCKNMLSFSGVIAGLVANSGLGLLVLFKDVKNVKKAVLITLLLFATSVVLGYATIFLG